MKDIKNLYRAAKLGKPDDVSRYREAVESLADNPASFITNLEYIISSDIGLNKLHTVVEKYGMPLYGFLKLESVANDLLERTENRGPKVTQAYRNIAESVSNFLDKNQHLVAMFEAMQGDEGISDKYLECYYSSISPAKDCGLSKLPSIGIIAVPDIILEASHRGTIDQVLPQISSSIFFNSPERKQWLLEAVRDITSDNTILESVRAGSLEEMAENALTSKKVRFREAALSDGSTDGAEYSAEELVSIYEYINFQEELLTTLRTTERQVELQRSIYEHYSELDGLVPESCSDVADLLPQPVIEGSDGKIPPYLAKNKTLRYGEDEDDDGDDEKYRRKKNRDNLEIVDYSSDDDKGTANPSDTGDDDKQPASPTVDARTDSKSSGGTTNYYYYTYTNSFNRNVDNSKHHTDNSTRTTNIYKDGKKGHDKDDPMTESTEVYSEGVIGAAVVLTLVGGAILYVVNRHLDRRAIRETLYEIAGRKVRNTDELVDCGRLLFRDILGNSDLGRMIIDVMYEPGKTGIQVPRSVGPVEFAIKREPTRDPGFISHYNFKRDELTVDNLYLMTRLPVAYGLVGDEEATTAAIEALNSKLAVTGGEVLAVISDPYLPIDDNGGDWELYIRAGLCQGGPEDFPGLDDIDKLDGETERAYNDYINECIRQVKESGYRICSIYLGVSAKNLLEIVHPKYKSHLDEHGIRFAESTKDDGDPNSIDPNPDKNGDPPKPESDHPVRDTLLDIDRAILKTGAKIKKKTQDVINVGKAAVRPITRSARWINDQIKKFRDADENNIKEKLLESDSRSGLYRAIRGAIVSGSLVKAGLLRNPLFLFLAVTRKVSLKANEKRIRNEIIAELRSEIEIIEEKIKDAERNGDTKIKYKLIRSKNDIKRKLIRLEVPALRKIV